MTNPEVKRIQIVYRPIDYFGWGKLVGPKLHAFFQINKDTYCELANDDGVIKIILGDDQQLSRATRRAMREGILTSGDWVSVDMYMF